jgi:3-oxoacyl-[acyl-carrier protein] reductase
VGDTNADGSGPVREDGGRGRGQPRLRAGISEVLAAEGAAVVFSGRQRGPVTATETALLAAGGKTVGVVADMTTREGALAIIRTAQEHFGDPDILVVNSPGAVPDPVTGRWRGFENSSDADFEEIYRNFVMSLVYLTRAVLPGMKARRWGRLLNIGSVAMKVPHLEDPMPAVNIRVAVNAVMKTLAQEYGPFGITANVIATGPFDSELSRDYRASDPGVKTEKWYRAMLPAGRWGNPVEMGWLAAFLCSERAAFLTGETIRLDGGYGKSLF